MFESRGRKNGPLVSVLLPTFNRRSSLLGAISSVLRQQYTNLELFVIRDGGDAIEDIVESFDDPRIVFLNRNNNCGKAFSLNEALASARGKYIAYLDDDDLYYPNHIGVLVNCLENYTDCQVAYSDLYRVYCRINQDGNREVLSKVLEVSRDFDRFVILYFNHVLHVSMMHHRDLLDKTGPYNENLSVLIDWDFTHRAAFFSDFHHVCELTGEYFSPVDDSDRISVVGRRNQQEYLRNVLQIRTFRPPKPWPKVDDVSIVLDTCALDENTRQTMLDIWRHTFYPYKVYLPLLRAEIESLNIDMPNVVLVPVDTNDLRQQRLDIALFVCEGEYTAIVPAGFPVGELWLEESLYSFVNSSDKSYALELEGSSDHLRAILARTDELRLSREQFSQLSLCESLMAAGITIKRISPDEIPFQLDQSLAQARLAGEHDNWRKAAGILEYAANHYGNVLWLKSLAAEAFFKAGDYDMSRELCRDVNSKRPVVDTLLLEAKVRRKTKDYEPAIELLQKAMGILEGTETIWT